ncbi:MAG: MauE/DoxX family redox-associated membrane protein [Segetibacter sp.]
MKKVSLYVMAGLYIAAGINHFIHPDVYLKIMPPWLKWQLALVIASGVLEILFGLMLFFPGTRQIASWCIIGLLVAVFPANIQMMVNYLHENNPRLWIAILRLPLQFVLIWWAYLFTKPIRRNK